MHIKDSNYHSFVETLLKAKKPDRIVYKKLITVRRQSPAQSQEKWVLDCHLKTCEDVDWKSVYQAPFKYKITKLITLYQYKCGGEEGVPPQVPVQVWRGGGSPSTSTSTSVEGRRESLHKYRLFWKADLLKIFKVTKSKMSAKFDDLNHLRS